MISVVDDDASVRSAVDNLLSAHGYQIETFASAEEFLRSARPNDTACVVADMQMAGMTGLDLLVHMRSQGNAAPFIFITAFPDESLRVRALQAGAICFLTKPFTAPSLITCLETALNQGQGGSG